MPWLKNPKGIRDIAEWYISTLTRRDYVYRVFERQCGIALVNLEKLHKHTRWKTFIHTFGSVVKLFPEFIEAGFDILNPVQTAVAGGGHDGRSASMRRSC